MSTKVLVSALVSLLALFMLGTLFIALTQNNVDWGWWWVLPIGGGFVLVIIGFRVLVQRSAEEAERLDRELDASEK